MPIERRSLLVGALAAALSSACGRLPVARESRFISGASDAHGAHYLAAFDGHGEVQWRTPLPFRGHEVVPSLDGEYAVLVARRPGTGLVRVRLTDGAVLTQTVAGPDRHFYGHGAITQDGAHLLTSENDFARERGVVSVRDARTLKVLEEYPSYGIGPHELRWLSDHRTLAIANGGISTHPAYGRSKLNVPDMQPSLALVDTQSWQLIGSTKPQVHLNSVRHIDVLPDDRVIIGMQHQGEHGTDIPIVAISSLDQGVRALPCPPADLHALAMYVADVCVDPATGHAVATCPRGNRITFWDTAHNAYVGSLRLADAAGVCIDSSTNEFVVTSGRGNIYRLGVSDFTLRADKTARAPGLRWDNHVVAV
ncbi:MAG: DUF1513 domain-containing protein [Pseudomonadota bacterium]